ncbi:hypothetical protein NKDENANG_00584 [Candidatus Entotheonellaceae bacterium PAL068K]
MDCYELQHQLLLERHDLRAVIGKGGMQDMASALCTARGFGGAKTYSGRRNSA